MEPTFSGLSHVINRGTKRLQSLADFSQMNPTIATYILAPAQKWLHYRGRCKKFFHGFCVFIFSGFLAASYCTADSGEQSDGLAQTINNRPLLNSERIKQQFGSYGIDVLEDDGAVRISSLYSRQGSQKITRTLAVVMYPAEVPQQIKAEHQAIRDGGSMGEVFTRSGWHVEKENLHLGEIQACVDCDEIYSLMGRIEPVALAVHIYRLWVCRDDSCFAYATLSEVHHPDYLRLRDLMAIYGSSGDALAQGKEWNRVGGKKIEQEVREALDLTIAALAAQ